MYRSAWSYTVPSTLVDETGQQQSKETQDRAHKRDDEAEQDMLRVQLHPFSQYPHRWALWVMMLLLLLATVLWVLSSLNLLQAMWATALNAVFTSLSTIIAVAQWHTQMPPERAHIAEDAYRPSLQRMTTMRKGAVVVYTPRTWRGTSLHLVAGFHEKTAIPAASIEAVSTVVEDQRTGKRMFLCSFPLVPPDHYTLFAPDKQRSTHITVRSGHHAEIDWRRR